MEFRASPTSLWLAGVCRQSAAFLGSVSAVSSSLPSSSHIIPPVHMFVSMSEISGTEKSPPGYLCLSGLER